jgi:predicted nucleotide-binding protein (sugar kinase/HSP70/actin superfamily)
MATDEIRLKGERFSDGRECNPHTILLGDLVSFAEDDSLPNTKKGFFIPGARGPCLLTHYAASYSRVLRKLDAEDILVWNPYGNELLEVLSMPDLVALWQGMVATDALFRWSCTLRPYERAAGSVDAARVEGLDLIRAGVRDGNVYAATRGAVALLTAVPSDRSDETRATRLKIGMIGDSYTRINPFANQGLYQILEDLGCEVLGPPFLLDGQLYDLYDHPREMVQTGRYRKAAWRSALALYQIEETWRIRRLFPDDPTILYDAGGRTWIRDTAPYLNSDVDGYLAQNIGKALDFIHVGADGLMNVMCHNCMVGLASDAISHRIRADHDVPFLSLAYDSVGDVHVRTRIEAFIDLLRHRR